MPQLSLYLDDAEMATLRADAKREGVSLSRYAARLVRDNAGKSKWPQGYWENVYGCLDDGTFVVNDADLAPALDNDTSSWFR